MPLAARNASVGALFTEHNLWLTGWLRRKLGCVFDAADLAQDTYLRVMVSGRVPAPEESRAHLTQIAKGLVIDLRRRRQLEAAYLEALELAPPAQAPSAEQHAAILETLRHIDTLLLAMPPKVRQAFWLSQVEGLNYAEIAVRMGVSLSSVKKYMVAALEAVYVAYAQEGVA